MAWYPAEYVERIALIKRLQEERFMPLRVIRDLVAGDPERARRMIELEDRILEQAALAGETSRVSRARVRETYDVPANVLERLEGDRGAHPEHPRLRPRRRGDHRGDLPLSRRRLRAVARVHRLRHAPLPDRAGAAGGGGGAGAARAAAGTGRGRPRGGDHRLRRRAAARPDRRHALQAAAGGAPPPARRERPSSRSPARSTRIAMSSRPAAGTGGIASCSIAATSSPALPAGSEPSSAASASPSGTSGLRSTSPSV